jgi:hypothetical protein
VFASPCLQDKNNDVFGFINAAFKDLKAILATLAIRPATIDTSGLKSKVKHSQLESED